jgi:hypothetical protein
MNEWISVSERLPEMDLPVWLVEGDRVWVGARGDDGEGWVWGNSYGSHYWDKSAGKWTAFDNECDDDYQPTHWQALPEPPK